MFPVALLNSEIAAATSPRVGCFLAAAMIMLGGTSAVSVGASSVVAATRAWITAVRSEVAFGCLFEPELSAGERPPAPAAPSPGYALFDPPGAAAVLATVTLPESSTL